MVKIEVLGGYREIGGNCIRVTDKDRVILFDQGIRFSLLKKYYSRLIQPTGLPELRKLARAFVQACWRPKQHLQKV